MGFRFNLQRVLDMRKESADQAGRRFEETQRACEHMRAVLRDELDAYFAEREIFNDASRVSAFAQLTSLDRALEARKRRLLEVMTALKEVESDLRLAEQALLLARRDLKAVENLRERRATEWTRAQEEKDRTFLDEMTTLRHARKA
jgi:flagellar export protein FliJ